MTGAFILLLAAQVAASSADHDRAVNAASPARSEVIPSQQQNETREERIARIRARLGVRGGVSGARVSKVRCGGTATCGDGCKTDAAKAPTRDLAVAGSANTASSDAGENTPTCSRRGV